MEILELENRAIHYEWYHIQSTIEAKESILEEMIGELDKKNSKILEQASSVEAENAHLLEQVFDAEDESTRLADQPSTSYAFEFLKIPRGRYEDSIVVQARLDVICDLKNTSCNFKTAIEEARDKAHEAWLGYDFDLDTPRPDFEESNGDVDQFADNA